MVKTIKLCDNKKVINIGYIILLLLVGLVIFIIIKKKYENFENLNNDTFFPTTKIIEHKGYGKIKCFNNNDYVCNIILNNQIWENDLYENIFKKYITDNITIIDCGSFIGSHTILLSKIHKNNDIIAFEMMPEHYKILLDNIKLNNLNNVLTFNMALNNNVGFINIPNINYKTDNTNFGGTSMHTNISEKSDLKIPTITLDYILPYINESKPVKFIKMDIEGNEIKCLEGSKNLLTKYKPIILIEIWSHEYQNFINNEIWGFLQKIGYKIKHINGDDYLLYVPGQFPDLE